MLNNDTILTTLVARQNIQFIKAYLIQIFIMIELSAIIAIIIG